MSNNSNIPYDIVSTNLYVKEKWTMKKSATQPVLKEAFHTYSDTYTIEPNTFNNEFVMVFEKFTISKRKKLILEVVEKNGGRRLEFEVNKDLIIKAPKLN